MHASARDVAKMLSYAMQNETFREIDGSGKNSITVTSADGSERKVTFRVWNVLLGKDGNIGGKTGTTSEAGMCFAGAFSREGEEIYVVVLGCPSDDERFGDTITLADWYYDHMETVNVVASDRQTMDGELLVGRATAADWTDKTVDVVASDPDATARVFTLEDDLSLDIELEELSGSVKKGDPAGTLTLFQGSDSVAAVDLVAAEDVAEPTPLEWLLVQFDRFTRWVTGEESTAPCETYATVPSLS